jgi:hypothetical protein
MSEGKDDRPNPLSDVRKGLGLLFRAARTAVSRLPKGDLEEAVVTSAREVGRAFESVATTIEREVRSAITRDGGQGGPETHHDGNEGDGAKNGDSKDR